jgi:Ca2+-binding EF-hand superfamily protein
LTPQQVHELHDRFIQLAEQSPNPTEKRKVIHRDQFKAALAQAGLDVEHDEVLARLFERFDNTEDSMIDFNEYIIGLSTVCKGSVHDKLQLAFEVTDEDGTKQISQPEMVSLLCKLDAQAVAIAPGTFDKKERAEAIKKFVQDIFEEFDRSRSGTLSFDEYFRAVMSHPELAELAAIRDPDIVHGDSKAVGSSTTYASSTSSANDEQNAPSWPTGPATLKAFISFGIRHGYLGRDPQTEKVIVKNPANKPQ